MFNLGHGVLPETDPDVLTRVVDLVHAQRAAATRDRAPAARPHVVVVGGGISGLAAALAVLDRSAGAVDVTVLEGTRLPSAASSR